MELGALNEVKAILKSLVLSSPDRMTVETLNRDYRDIEGEFIPFRRLGFNNLENFLHSIPDTLLVDGFGYSASVYFVSNDKSKHVHDMIMKQKKPKIRLKGKPMIPRFNRSNACDKPGRQNNNYEAVKHVRRMQGHQFSPFQTTKRNVSVRTIAVRDIPSYRPPERANNNCDIKKSSPVLNPLPHPNGIDIPLSAKNNGKNVDKPKPQEIKKTNDIPSKGGIEPKVKESISKTEEIVNIVIDGKQSNKQNSKIKTEVNDIVPNSNIKSKTNNERETMKYDVMSKYQESTKDPLAIINHSSTASKPLNKSHLFAYNSSDTPPKNENKNYIAEPEESTTSDNFKKFQEDIKQLENLLNTTCHVSAPDMPVVKSVTFSPDVQSKDIACGGMTDETLDKILSHKILKRHESLKNNTAQKSKGFFDINDESLTDLDEAIPKFAANNKVFRLDFPKCSVTYGHKIPKCKLPDDIQVGSCIGIFIAEIHNPFKFWFHIYNDNHGLDNLMNQIERFYTHLDPNELRIPIMCLSPGQVCAASFNKMWHRAEIISPPVDNKIKVSFIDYGTVSEVNIMEIKYLASNFAQLPAQAVRGSLSHIKPRGLHWSHEATLHFLHLVSEKMLFAKITEIDMENSVYHMILCDTHNDEVKQINREMVLKRFAHYNTNWDENKIKKNNGHRVHHPREDFPT